MKHPTMHIAAAIACAALAALGPGSASAQGRPLSASLTGAAEVPGPGDADGSGEFFATVNPGLGEICYQLSVADIVPATAAHIHAGPAGVAGGVVVGLVPPTSGTSSDCVAVDRDIAMAILRDPAVFYVNVHNALFPAGAIRGQLGK